MSSVRWTIQGAPEAPDTPGDGHDETDGDLLHRPELTDATAHTDLADHGVAGDGVVIDLTGPSAVVIDLDARRSRSPKGSAAEADLVAALPVSADAAQVFAGATRFRSAIYSVSALAVLVVACVVFVLATVLV